MVISRRYQHLLSNMNIYIILNLLHHNTCQDSIDNAPKVQIFSITFRPHSRSTILHFASKNEIKMFSYKKAGHLEIVFHTDESQGK